MNPIKWQDLVGKLKGNFFTLILTHPLNFFKKISLCCPVPSYHIMGLDRKAPTNLVLLGGSVEDIPQK